MNHCFKSMKIKKKIWNKDKITKQIPWFLDTSNSRSVVHLNRQSSWAIHLGRGMRSSCSYPIFMKKSAAGPIFFPNNCHQVGQNFFKEMAPRLVSFQLGLRYWDYAAMFVLLLVLPLLFGESVWHFLQKRIKDGIEVHPFPHDRITKTHFKYQSEWNEHQITMVLLMHHFNQSATIQSKIGPQKNE